MAEVGLLGKEENSSFFFFRALGIKIVIFVIRYSKSLTDSLADMTTDHQVDQGDASGKVTLNSDKVFGQNDNRDRVGACKTLDFEDYAGLGDSNFFFWIFNTEVPHTNVRAREFCFGYLTW